MIKRILKKEEKISIFKKKRFKFFLFKYGNVYLSADDYAKSTIFSEMTGLRKKLWDKAAHKINFISFPFSENYQIGFTACRRRTRGLFSCNIFFLILLLHLSFTEMEILKEQQHVNDVNIKLKNVWGCWGESNFIVSDFIVYKQYKAKGMNKCSVSDII